MAFVHLGSFHPRKFEHDELSTAFAVAGIQNFRVPGRAQTMDAHEVRGLLQSYIMMAGGQLAAADGEWFEVPDRARPMLEDMRRVHRALYPNLPKKQLLQVADDAPDVLA